MIVLLSNLKYLNNFIFKNNICLFGAGVGLINSKSNYTSIFNNFLFEGNIAEGINK